MSLVTFVSGITTPQGIAFDSSGNLYCSSQQTNSIIKITPAGVKTTFANNVGISIVTPIGLAFDISGNLYCASSSNGNIIQITPIGLKTVFVSGLNVPFSLAFDSSGNLYCADAGNNNIIKITRSKVVSTFANSLGGSPRGIAIDNSGNVYYINGFGGTLFKITSDGTTKTQFATGLGDTAAPFLAFDISGNLYCSNGNSGIIRKITTTGTVTTVFNNLDNPTGIALDTTGNLYCATNESILRQKTEPTINLTIPNKIFGNGPFTISPTSNSSGLFTYTSSNISVATISGTTITTHGAGTTNITVTQAETANYKEGSKIASLTVAKANPTFTNFSNITKIFGVDSSFEITPPTSNSTGLFSYASSNLSVATISGNIITISGLGSSIITANQAETDNYTSRDISASLTIEKATPNITNFSIPNKTYGIGSFEITHPTSTSTGSFSYASSNPLVATISGIIITIGGAGTTDITVSQAETANYIARNISASLTVIRATPNITNFSIPTKTYGIGSFEITPPTSTNLTSLFSYASSEPSVATISGNIITICGAGTTDITASQAETDNYFARNISASLIVNQATPIINFSIPDKTYGDIPFTISPPTSNSTGSFSYASSNPLVAISGNIITICGAGTTDISASQVATTNYIAIDISARLIINKATPNITNFSNLTKTYGNDPFTISPTSNSTGLFSYASSNPLVATISGATISGTTITIGGAGTTDITASQAETANYIARNISASLTVNQATPNITNFSIPTKTYGIGSFEITPPTSTNLTGLFSYASSNISVATISGIIITIGGAGTTDITATQAATTNYIARDISASLTVERANPTFTNFSNLTKIFGVDSSFVITPPTSTNLTGSFSYASNNQSVATISGNTITISGAGTTDITASQADTDNYNPGSITITLTVNKIIPTLTNFYYTRGIVKTRLPYAPPFNFTLTVPSSNSDGFFNYTSSNGSVATVSGNVVTVYTDGYSRITATQSPSGIYESGSINTTLLVSNINIWRIPKPANSDNSLVFYKPGSFAAGGSGSVRNSSIISRRV
jgi:streptogramin lyase